MLAWLQPSDSNTYIEAKGKRYTSGNQVFRKHFLANADFGPVVIFLNFCAQYIGGIVMVKVPDWSKQLGFIQ